MNESINEYSHLGSELLRAKGHPGFISESLTSSHRWGMALGRGGVGEALRVKKYRNDHCNAWEAEASFPQLADSQVQRRCSQAIIIQTNE